MTDEEARRDYLTVNEAARLLGISRTRMWQLAKQHELETFELPADRRVKLFRRADVLALLNPRPKSEAA
ncbi:MAG: helix-turn-helix domain-containing protein [Chloroflexota bacterium]